MLVTLVEVVTVGDIIVGVVGVEFVICGSGRGCGESGPVGGIVVVTCGVFEAVLGVAE